MSVGGENFSLVCGPCSIESDKLLFETGEILKTARIDAFRGGIHKLRTQPDSFQGLGVQILESLGEFKKKFKLPVFSEITDVRHIEMYAPVVDVFQVGSRNMYNYPMLAELGKLKRPVLLKRAFSATIKEWLSAARYIEKEGNENIILCERGIRSFDPELRSTLDLGSVAFLKAETDYPVFVDPSHAAGRRDLVLPLSFAAHAVGADGLLVEYHPRPDEAASDGAQSIDTNQLQILSSRLSRR